MAPQQTRRERLALVLTSRKARLASARPWPLADLRARRGVSHQPRQRHQRLGWEHLELAMVQEFVDFAFSSEGQRVVERFFVDLVSPCAPSSNARPSTC